jgi:hypothetical protein
MILFHSYVQFPGGKCVLYSNFVGLNGGFPLVESHLIRHGNDWNEQCSVPLHISPEPVGSPRYLLVVMPAQPTNTCFNYF